MKYHLSLNWFSVKANSRSHNLYGCPELWPAPFHHGRECSLTWAMAGTLSPWSETLTDLGYGWHPFTMVWGTLTDLGYDWSGLWLAPFHHGWERSLAWEMTGIISPWSGMLTVMGYDWHPFTMVWCSLTLVIAGTLSPWSGTLTVVGYDWHPSTMVKDAHWPGLWLVPFHYGRDAHCCGLWLTWVMAGTLSYLFSVKHCEMRSAAFSTVVSSGSSFGGSILSHGTVS